MNKYLLSFLLTFSVAIGAFAQNFTLSYTTTTYQSGDLNQAIDALVKVTNTSGTTLNMLVLRKTDNVAAGHFSNFCWGPSCYAPVTSLSSDTVAIAPGVEENSFKGTLSPFGIEGTSVVEYCFFDYNTPQDSACVTITYIYDAALSVAENVDQATFSLPYPNPSSQFVMFSYDLLTFKSGSVQIHNVLGSLVKEVKLTDKKATTVIPVSDLQAGIYFATLTGDGKKILSRRIVISR